VDQLASVEQVEGRRHGFVALRSLDEINHGEGGGVGGPGGFKGPGRGPPPGGVGGLVGYR
jgi:hypothetical protein